MWLAFAGQALFVVSWIVAGALEPRYSHVEHHVSELAARGASHPWIVTAGIVCFALSFFALAAALGRILRRRRALPVVLFAAIGVAAALSAAFQLDCGFAFDSQCRALWEEGRLSWRTEAHVWTGIATQLLLPLTPFALARALWPGTAGVAALVAGAVGAAIAAVSFVRFAGDVEETIGGLAQRVDLAVVHLWVVIVGVGVLYATRAAPAPGTLVPLRPRDFFARGWTGTGELVLRPFLLGRLFTQRFEIRRDATWMSDRVWRFDDSAHFGDGSVESRQTWAEFASDDHIRLTAGDLPDGIDVRLEEGGFRIAPFRVAYPVGPVPALVRCVDRSYVDHDGTFVNRFDVYTPGPRIPVARVTFRVRPLDPPPEADAESAQRAMELT